MGLHAGSVGGSSARRTVAAAAAAAVVAAAAAAGWLAGWLDANTPLRSAARARGAAGAATQTHSYMRN